MDDTDDVHVRSKHIISGNVQRALKALGFLVDTAVPESFGWALVVWHDHSDDCPCGHHAQESVVVSKGPVGDVAAALTNCAQQIVMLTDQNTTTH